MTTAEINKVIAACEAMLALARFSDLHDICNETLAEMRVVLNEVKNG